MLGAKLLTDYLHVTHTEPKDFAPLVRSHRSQIQRACQGKRGPGLELALRIEEETDGAVPAWTWVMDEPPNLRRYSRAPVHHL